MKAQIDKYVTENYEDLISCIGRKVNYFKSTVKEEVLLSLAYVYLIENNPPEESLIPSYLLNFVNQQLYYPRSDLNRKHVLRSIEFNDNSLNYTLENALDLKLDTEAFIKKLDRVDQIVWRVMVEDGLTKVRELSEHFNIPESTIYLYRVRILNKFKEHYIENYED